MTGPALEVGFDVTALFAGSTGVARYVRELTTALDARNDVSLTRYAIGRARNPVRDPHRVRHLPIPLRAVHRGWSLVGEPSGRWLAPGCDLFHSPDLVPPPTKRPVVMTVHDLDAFLRPELHPPRAARIQRAQLEAAVRRADVVLCVSNTTASVLADHGVDQERIVVTPNGVTPLPAPERSIVPGHPFLLSVGALMPRKGLETLIAALARSSVRDTRLVLAGPESWEGDRTLAAAKDHGIADRVIRTGQVSDAQLAALYESCIAVCVPSLAEGFGLPVIEAAAAGAAVVASDLSSLRELDGAVTLYARPGDEADWADALERIVTDRALRHESRAKRREYARTFTWERTAAITAAAYQRAVQGG